MQTSLDFEIRDHLASYLAGETPLRAFEDWFVPATWGKVGKEGPGTDALIGEIELRLAELTSGHRTEDEIRQFLVPFVTRYVIDAATAHTASVAAIIQKGVTLLPEFAGTLEISGAVPV